jgi:hypothetical protein
LTDPNLTTIDVEFASVIVNTVLLLGLGLIMIYAKQIDKIGKQISARLGQVDIFWIFSTGKEFKVRRRACAIASVTV